VLGEPDSGDRFFFLADVVLPAESTPRISARLYGPEGNLLCEVQWNRLGRNPGRCTYRSLEGGFRILDEAGSVVLEVMTEKFPRGYLSGISGRLFDEEGRLRLEPLGDNSRIPGEPPRFLTRPYGGF